MYSATLLLLFMGVVTGLPQDAQQLGGNIAAKFQCPDLFGTFEDPQQCDKYWECDDGIAIPHLCDDGLVFDIYKANAGTPDPCESPYVVDCGERLELQPLSFTSEQCPRKNGIFADPDPAICNRFYTCIKGYATVTECASGLHFDENNGNCAWPHSSGRTGCRASNNACLGTFCCPEGEQLSADGVKIPHPTFPNLDDCQKFYVCLNGEKPQESSCAMGEVYNEGTHLCDYPENVSECIGWYRDHPDFAHYYEYEDNNAGTDVGKQDIPG